MTIKLAHITDLHITSPAKYYPELDGNTQQTLQRVLSRIADYDLDGVLCTGDITDLPTEAAYHQAFRQLSELEAPVYCLPGNHDDPELGQRIAKRYDIHWPRSLELENWQIIFLSSHQEGATYGHLGARELVTLKTRLEENPTLHTLVALHHHPVKMNSRWMDELMLQDSRGFLDVVDAYGNVKAVLWGHVHQEFSQVRNSFQMLATPSTGRQFTPLAEDFTLDDKPPAFRLLSLKPTGEIETETVYCPK